MALRGARVLLAGACTETGQALTEACLALGAHVVAADRLRTRLEALRADLRQHERLWVAESDLSRLESALKLFADVARDEPIDAAVCVLPRAGEDLWNGEAGELEDRLAALPRCLWFLRAALAHVGGATRGRALVVLESDPGDLAAAVGPAVAALVERCANHAQAARPRLSVGGLVVAPPLAAARSAIVALLDPDQPALSGFRR